MRSTSLRDGIDRDIYHIVKGLEDGRSGRLTVTSVYDSIKRSNSSLARQKKRLLEDCIERVLTYRREEAKADEAAGDSDEVLEREAVIQVLKAKREKRSDRDGFLLNKQMTKHWDFSTTSTATAKSPGTTPTSTGQNGAAKSGSEGASDALPSTRMDIDGGLNEAGAVGLLPVMERQPNGEPRLKRKRKRRTREDDQISAFRPGATLKLSDMAGIDHITDELHDLIWTSLQHGDLFQEIGFTPKDAILLHGPSGTGKTVLVHAIAEELDATFIPVSSTSLISGISGESEKNIREFFDEAIRLAPTLLFIDEIDAVAGKSDSVSKAMEVRMTSEVSQGLDRIGRLTGSGRHVVVVAATNRPDSIEPTVRRRFQEVEMSMPDEKARESILRAMTRSIALSEDVDFAALARLTPGYVGADLQRAVDLAVHETVKSVCREGMEKARLAMMAETGGEDALRKMNNVKWVLSKAARAARATKVDDGEMDGQVSAVTTSQSPLCDAADRNSSSGSQEEKRKPRLRVTFEHLKTAVARVQPAAKREGFSTIPNTTWAEIGAMQAVRKKLEMAIVQPIEMPEQFSKLGMKPAAGILLWGPPGCGKTLVAKAVANASKANFISVKGPELLNKYVGESEQNVRRLFARAKSSAPCILFFDELDALAPTRDFGGASSSAATSRVVNALLTELDGVEDRKGIYVIGATNRPDAIDEAIRRPGRLGTEIYVGLPTPDDRVEILRTIYATTVPSSARNHNPLADAMIEAVARDARCDRFTGADLRQLLQAASEACLTRYLAAVSCGKIDGDTDPEIEMDDWVVALNEVKPSVKDIDKYLEASQGGEGQGKIEHNTL